MREVQTVSHNNLSALFRPNSIAVVGASPSSIFGRQALENFQQLGYTGRVVAVNPKYEEILGYRCYRSLKSIPFVPEAVLLLCNRGTAIPVIEEAGDLGVRAAVVVAIGFAEAGAEGAAAQARIVDVARTSGMAVLGPNCSGLINWVDRVPLHLNAVDPKRPGSVALISQGGGPKTALVGNRRGVRWSHVVTCGNEAVLGSADFLGYFVDDPHVRVICAFMETIRDPERFFFECDRARAAGKPVIILKAGRTEAARKMAAAHTGALAAPLRLYRELFRRHGIVQVDTLEELLASALALQARPTSGGRLGAAVPSGGLLQLVLDESEKCSSLSFPDFQPQTATALRGLMPELQECRNPVDSWGIPNMEDSYPKILQTIERDPNVDVLLTYCDPGHVGTRNAEELELFINGAVRAAAETKKLVIMITPIDGSLPPENVEEFLDKGVLVLGLQEAFTALDRAVKWRQCVPPMAEEPPVDKSALLKHIHEFGGKPFAGRPALDFLAAAGIPVVESRFVTSVKAAISAADELGYPVVVKIGDTDVLHRTELSGVITNLRSAQEVSAAATKLFAAGSRLLMVQPYVRDGIEMILGLQTDDVLGPFVLVGQGGIWTEIMDDAALRPAGLRVGEPEQMLAELRVHQLLRGIRGAAAVDIPALVGAVRRLDAIARSLGDQISSIDINPLFVREEGVVAVDALIVPASSANGSRRRR